MNWCSVSVDAHFSTGQITQPHCGTGKHFWWRHEHSICSAYICIQFSRTGHCSLKKSMQTKCIPLLKWVWHYLGKNTNNEQVILFALLYPNIKPTKEEITCTECTHNAPAPITAVACYLLCGMDTLIFHHCVYSFCQVDFVSSLHRKANKERWYFFRSSAKCAGSLEQGPLSHLLSLFVSFKYNSEWPWTLNYLSVRFSKGICNNNLNNIIIMSCTSLSECYTFLKTDSNTTNWSFADNKHHNQNFPMDMLDIWKPCNWREILGRVGLYLLTQQLLYSFQGID